MPAGPRIRSNSEFGLITDNPLTAGATTFNSARLSLMPVVSAAHAVVTLDPRAVNGEPEIVIITAHTAAATVATITRGAYGTVARSHPVNTEWIHAPIDEDFIEILTSGTRPTDPYRGQAIFETDTNSYQGRSTADAWQNINMFADPPACSIFRNADESLASNIGETISYTGERYDTANMWSVGSPTIITIPVTGLYVLTLNVAFLARNDYEVCWGAIFNVSAGVYLGLQTSRAAIVGASDCHCSVVVTAKFTAGNTVRTEAYQRNTAAAAANLRSVSQLSPEFTATWVGRG